MPRTLRKEAILDKTGTQVLAHKSATELKQMLSTGEVIHVCRRCGGPATAKRCHGVSAKKQPHQLIYVATDLFRETRLSHSSISLAEVLANVGIAHTIGRVKAARRKIQAWPFVGDTKAVRVGGWRSPESPGSPLRLAPFGCTSGQATGRLNTSP